jgi:hypothetical protein
MVWQAHGCAVVQGLVVRLLTCRCWVKDLTQLQLEK